MSTTTFRTALRERKDETVLSVAQMHARRITVETVPARFVHYLDVPYVVIGRRVFLLSELAEPEEARILSQIPAPAPSKAEPTPVPRPVTFAEPVADVAGHTAKAADVELEGDTPGFLTHYEATGALDSKDRKAIALEPGAWTD